MQDTAVANDAVVANEASLTDDAVLSDFHIGPNTHCLNDAIFTDDNIITYSNGDVAEAPLEPFVAWPYDAVRVDYAVPTNGNLGEISSNYHLGVND